MSLIADLRDDYRRITRSAAELKTEDAYRRLATADRAGYRLPLVYANNDFALTQTGALMGFTVPPKPWGFLDEARRKQYIRAANGVFERIFPAGKDNSGHLVVTNRVYSADDWKTAMAETWKDTSLPMFGPFLDQTAEIIGQREFFERECYLFTRLGSRGGGTGIRGLARWLIETIAVGAGLDDSQPDPEEIDFWTNQARTVEDTLSNSWLQAIPVSRRRLEWMVRHNDTPGLPTPNYAPADAEAWGAGEWRTTLASYTQEVDLGQVGKDRLRCVEFTAPVGTGKAFAAYLPLNIVPSHLYGGQNWAHHASTLPFPVDLSMHFEIVDPDRAEKVLERPITAAETQEEEDRDAGVRTDDTTAIQQQGLRDVKTKVRLQRKPLAYWQAVFCVYADTKEELLSRVARLIRHYKDIQMELVCPRDDQRELFYQSFPGSDILVQDWMHRTDTLFLAASMPWLTSNVGDRDAMGLYQGFTFEADANGTLQKGVPVMTDLWSVVDDEGKAPTEVVCGFPGSGKSTALSVQIPTPSGFVKMGAIKVGDEVFDENGVPTTVTFATEVMYDHDVFDVTFDDGTVVRADADHRWFTEDRAARMSARSARKDRHRKAKGSRALVAALEHLISTVDPEDTTTPTLLLAELGEPGRDIYLRLSKTLTPVGSYVQPNHRGGGRRYPLYSKVDFAKALLAWADEVAYDQQHLRALPQVRTTRQILDTLTADGGRPNHSIPVTEPVQYPERDLPLDPYLLGAWLGDGQSNGQGKWCSEDPEILDAFTQAGFDVSDPKPCVNHQTYSIRGLRKPLRAAGVLDNKHIPDAYLLASVEQRLALLQGLMDTDGSVNPQGSCEFYQSDEAFARQVRSLVASLGMKATLRSKPGGYKDADGVWVECTTAWTVAFAPNCKVVRLQRKLERLTLTDRRSTAERRYITAVTPVASEPVRCITVDSPNHLYLVTDQYVPTHNTVSRGLKVALEDGLRGLTQFIWDPKGDFLPLSIYAEEMQLDPSKVKLVDLYNPNVSVSLDPFSIAEVDEERGIDERGSAALDTLNSLCSEYLEGAAGLEYRSILQEAVTIILAREDDGQGRAKMLGVMRLLGEWAEGKFEGVSIRAQREGDWTDYARNLVKHLDQVEQNVLGRLLFRDPDTAGSIKITEGDMIIFVALKMNPTEPGEKPTFSSKISDVIAGMMADFIRALLFRLPAEVPKSAVFDEWHVIKRTQRAEALADWLRRMGRSRRCCVRQMSQSAFDFSKGSLSTVWCGYAQNVEEAIASCALLGIEPSEANIGMLQSLRAGQFVFRDVLGRVARVEVDIWDDWLMEKFNTNAKQKAEMLAALAGQTR